MNEAVIPALRSPRVGFARARQLIGWAGLAGLALTVAAAVIFGLAWAARTTATIVLPPPAAQAAANPIANDAAAETDLPAPPELPRPADVPLLLTQIMQIAITNGLGWAAADYRIVPATDTQPASLELRSSFKAPYPKLRSLVSQVLREVPAATLRELSFSRGSSEVAEVDAKLTIAVLLQDEALSSTPPRAKSAP